MIFKTSFAPNATDGITLQPAGSQKPLEFVACPLAENIVFRSRKDALNKIFCCTLRVDARPCNATLHVITSMFHNLVSLIASPIRWNSRVIYLARNILYRGILCQMIIEIAYPR